MKIETRGHSEINGHTRRALSIGLILGITLILPPERAIAGGPVPAVVPDWVTVYLEAMLSETEYHLYKIGSEMAPPPGTVPLSEAWMNAGIDWTWGVNQSAVEGVIASGKPVSTTVPPNIGNMFLPPDAPFPTTGTALSGFGGEVGGFLEGGYSLEWDGTCYKLCPPPAGTPAVGPAPIIVSGDNVVVSPNALNMMLEADNVQPGVPSTLFDPPTTVGPSTAGDVLPSAGSGMVNGAVGITLGIAGGALGGMVGGTVGYYISPEGYEEVGTAIGGWTGGVTGAAGVTTALGEATFGTALATEAGMGAVLPLGMGLTLGANTSALGLAGQLQEHAQFEDQWWEHYNEVMKTPEPMPITDINKIDSAIFGYPLLEAQLPYATYEQEQQLLAMMNEIEYFLAQQGLGVNGEPLGR